MILALILGAFLGFVSAVPVAGPVSAVIFSRGVAGKYSQGRWISVGAGMIEGAYAFVAFWGFSHFLKNLSIIVWISNLVAAILLFFLGIYFYRSKKMRQPHTSPKKSNEQKAVLMGAGMAVANPSLIASWTITATTIYSMKLFPYSTLNAGLFAGGVYVGIVCWFVIMMKIMETHRNNLDPRLLDRGLKGIAYLLWAISIYLSYKLLTQ